MGKLNFIGFHAYATRQTFEGFRVSLALERWMKLFPPSSMFEVFLRRNYTAIAEKAFLHGASFGFSYPRKAVFAMAIFLAVRKTEF